MKVYRGHRNELILEEGDEKRIRDCAQEVMEVLKTQNLTLVEAEEVLRQCEVLLKLIAVK